MRLALQLPFKDIFPNLDVAVEGGLDDICLLDFGVTIEDAAGFLLLLELIDDSLAGGVEFFDVLAEHGQAVEDDA